MTPCQDPANDPEDWFISRDGKQYPDDDLLDEETRLKIATLDEDEQAKVTEAAEAEALKASLRRRRHARDKCYTECLLRTACLNQALETGVEHGTWGGYHEEQLRELRRAIERRRTGGAQE